MFIVSKFVAIFLNPLLWIFVGLFFVWRMKNAKKRKYVLGLWILMCFVLTNAFVLEKCLERYEMPFRPIAEGKIYDCAIVLSGAAGYDSFSRSLQFSEAAERITEPILLYRNGRVKKLIISGGSANVFPPYLKEANYIRKFWIQMGIPEKDIIVESEARNTSENAKYSKEIIQKYNIGKNRLLITSALHMPRSAKIFNSLGLIVDCYPVDFKLKRIKETSYDFTTYFMPKTSALLGWEALLHEWVGMLAAKI